MLTILSKLVRISTLIATELPPLKCSVMSQDLFLRAQIYLLLWYRGRSPVSSETTGGVSMLLEVKISMLLANFTRLWRSSTPFIDSGQMLRILMWAVEGTLVAAWQTALYTPMVAVMRLASLIQSRSWRRIQMSGPSYSLLMRCLPESLPSSARSVTLHCSFLVESPSNHQMMLSLSICKPMNLQRPQVSHLTSFHSITNARNLQLKASSKSLALDLRISTSLFHSDGLKVKNS